MGKTLLLWLACMFSCAGAWAQELADIPAYAPVVDRTGTLTAEQQAALTHKLAEFEREHGSELAVVLVPTTQPEPIEDYANRLANTWKLGRAQIGDGVVVVIATKDRASRIEVAKALEGAIPDLAAKQILRRHMTPAFKQGAFHEGIDAGLDALFARIVAEALPEPEPPAPPPKPLWKSALEWIFVAVLVVFSLVWKYGLFVVIVVFVVLHYRGKPATHSSSSHRWSDDTRPATAWSSSAGNSDGGSSSNWSWSSSSSSSDSSSSSSSSDGGGDYGGGGASDRW